MSPTNPHLPCTCCRPQQCKASQLQWRFCWLCPSVESSAHHQVQQRITQVWRPCCHTIWQHRCCDSPPLWRHSFLSPFSSSSSRLQGYSWVGSWVDVIIIWTDHGWLVFFVHFFTDIFIGVFITLICVTDLDLNLTLSILDQVNNILHRLSRLSPCWWHSENKISIN